MKVKKVDPAHNDPTAKVYRGLGERPLFIIDLEQRLDKTGLIHVDEESFGHWTGDSMDSCHWNSDS